MRRLALVLLLAGFGAVYVVKAYLVEPLVQVIPVVDSGADAGSVEITMLRAQLEQARAHDAQIVGMAASEFQIVGAVALALAAFSWYTTHRSYERDRDSLQREVHHLVEQERTTLEAAVPAVVDAKNKRLVEGIDTVLDRKAAELSGDTHALRQDSLWIDYRLCILEAEHRRAAGSSGSALLAYVRALAALQGIENATNIMFTGSCESIEQLMTNNHVRPSALQIGEMNSVVEGLAHRPDEQGAVRHTLEQMRAAAQAPA